MFTSIGITGALKVAMVCTASKKVTMKIMQKTNIGG